MQAKADVVIDHKMNYCKSCGEELLAEQNSVANDKSSISHLLNLSLNIEYTV